MPEEQKIACPTCGNTVFPHDDVCLTCGWSKTKSRWIKPATWVKPSDFPEPSLADVDSAEPEKGGSNTVLLLVTLGIGAAVICFLWASGLGRIFAHGFVWIGIGTIVLISMVWSFAQRENERRQFAQLHRRRHDPATDAGDVAAIQMQIENMHAKNSRRRFWGRFWW